jgi:flagellar biosynthesis protein FliR
MPMTAMSCIAIVGATLSILFLPADAALSIGSLDFAYALIQNVAQGLVLALPCVVALEAVSLGVRAIDVGRGAFFAEQMGLEAEGRGSPLEYGVMLAVFVLFFSSGGHHEIVRGLVQSGASDLTSCVVAKAHCAPEVITSVLRTISSTLSHSLLVVLPILVVMSITDVGAQFMAKFAERLSIYTEISGLKMLLGLALAGIGVWYWG